MVNFPVVSVIIPTYNAGETLRTCLDSVLGQTYPLSSLDVIVSDDCSNDGVTLDVCEEYQKAYPNSIRVLRSKENCGCPSGPRNEAVDIARGEWLFFLDADDWLAPEAIQRAVTHALSWGSDCVMCRMVRAESGKALGYISGQRKGMTSVPDVDVFTCREFHELSNVIARLVRTDLVRKNSIRFLEVYPEDAAWFYRVTFAAEKCSMANDYEYYFLRREAGLSTMSTGAFDAAPIKSPESLLAGVREAFAAYADGVGNRVCLPALRKLIRTTMRNAFKRIAEWADAFPEEFPDGGRLYCEKIVDIVRPFVGESCRLEDTPRLLSAEALETHRVAADDLRKELTLEECVMLDSALAGEYRWWASGPVLQAKNSPASTAPKMPEAFGAWASAADRASEAKVLSAIAFERMAENQVRGLDLIPHVVEVDGDALVVRGVARSISYAVPYVDAAADEAGCESHADAVGELGGGSRSDAVADAANGLSFHVALRKKGVDIPGEFRMAEGAWGVAGQHPFNWEARFALSELAAVESKLLILQVDVLLCDNVCRTVSVGSGEHVDLLGRHVLELDEGIASALLEGRDVECGEPDGEAPEGTEATEADEVPECDEATEAADAPEGAEATEGTDVAEETPQDPLVLGAVFSRIDNRFTVTRKSSLEERLSKSEHLLQVKTTLQKRNEEIASLKEENERLRASLAAVKNELKEERESRKGGLFSRLGKR
ncbi:MAG: glycosyltransferase [Eggerthellales bacterium]|nr:glycosyltransferase [Eggerthellales bacterium]